MFPVGRIMDQPTGLKVGNQIESAHNAESTLG
jgi:hypothetical protein